MQRRLAAIFAADVVGYSRLMGDDEVGTLSRLEGLKVEILDPLIAQHHGRIVKLMGDGFLIEFASVVDALECAIGWQEAVNARARLIDKDRAIRFRIGINLGDVIVKEDDVFGDGVNVAARLEALAEPGEILVSRTVADHVKGKIAPGFEDLGERELKNISAPVQVFRVVPPLDVAGPVTGVSNKPRPGKFAFIAAGLAVAALVVGGLLWQINRTPHEEPASEANMAFPLPDRPSIAVLPFNNMSEDASQEYFADGMTEDLITDLSKISGLFVIARNSSFSYKGKQVKVRQVAEELGVRYVLEGSVRRAGDQVRINAQLIDATTGGHLWAERYDGPNADIFALQDKVTSKIVSALALNLTPTEANNVTIVETSNVQAHDAYLLGQSLYHRRTPADNAAAGRAFEKAIERDPDYAAAYSALAKVYVQGVLGMHEYSLKLGFGWFDGTARPWVYLQKAKSNPNKDYYLARSRLALKRHQTGVAIAQARRALDLSSNDAEAMEALAEALIFSGQPAAGLEYAKQAMRQNPTLPGRPLYLIGLAEYSLGNTSKAVEILQDAVRNAPNERIFSGLLAAALGNLGQVAQAAAAFGAFKQSVSANWNLPDVVSLYPFSSADTLARFANGLKKAGVPVRSGGYLALHDANRLTGAEIKSLLFGKRIKGKRYWDGASAFDWSQQRTAGGTVKHSGYNIQPGISTGDTGVSRIEDDLLCETWPKLAKDIEICAAVFRVTDRIARIKWGDYVMVTDTGPHPFSPAD